MNYCCRQSKRGRMLPLRKTESQKAEDDFLNLLKKSKEKKQTKTEEKQKEGTIINWKTT